MKPLFGAIIFMFMLFLTEIETADKKLKQIKTRRRAAEPNDERRRGDERTILNIATPARQKQPHQRWAGFEYGKDFDPTGKRAQHMFVDHYQERGLPNTPDVTLELYKERHNHRGFYYLPEEDGGLCLSDRYHNLQKEYTDPLVEPHHQAMYEKHQYFQNGSSFRGKLLKIETGSLHLPEEQGGSTTHRLQEVRKRDGKPLVQQDNQLLYQQHRNFQDHHECPGSSSRRKSTGKNAQNMSVDHHQEQGLPNTPAATHELNTQRDVGGSYEHHMYQQHQALPDQFGGSESGSAYNYLYTAPPMSPSNDMHPLFYIPPPEDQNFEQNCLKNNPSATALMENHYIHLRRQYGDRSRDSASG